MSSLYYFSLTATEPPFICNPMCDVNANCKNFTGTPSCMCKVGFDGDGVKCTGQWSSLCIRSSLVWEEEGQMIQYRSFFHTIDIDECYLPGGNECDSNALCTNTDGSYICRCLKGYEGDGRACTGENPCLQLVFKGPCKEIIFWQICIVSIVNHRYRRMCKFG